MSRQREAAERVVRTLVSAGHTAYFAGGCVRDELLGLEPTDYDVATDAHPDVVERLFRRTKSVGKSFGVVLVRDSGTTTEVATFREESGYSDKRRPDEVRFADAEADARRRDFTINALFIDPLDARERAGGRLIDHVGGADDLERRTLRAVGDPSARLAEDHLRGLRAVRFASRLGFAIDDATRSAVRAHASELEGVSRERVGDEVRRMLSHKERATSARLMQSLALDAPVLRDGAMPDAELLALESLTPGAGATLALAAWAVDRLASRDERLDESGVATIVRRLRGALVLTNDESDDLRDVLTSTVRFRDDWEDAGVAQRKRWGAHPSAVGAIALIASRHPERADALRADIEKLSRTPSGLAPEPLVTGDALIAAGLSPGPMFGTWLDKVYDEQLEERVRTPESALGRVLEWARGGDSGE